MTSVRTAGLRGQWFLAVAFLATSVSATHYAYAQQPYTPPLHLGENAPPRLSFADFKYGPNGRDRADLLVHKLPGRAPIVILIPSHDAISEQKHFHTGWLPSFLFEKGFASAHIWPRRQRDISGADYMALMAKGIAEIARRGEQRGFDGSRLFLVGQGWGGQAAALLATDPRYLEAEGINFGSIRGAVILNGEGFDLPKYLASSTPYRKTQLQRVVGRDGAAENLSPVHQLEAPNAPRFLLYSVAGDADSRLEAETFATSLRQAASEAQVRTMAKTRPGASATLIGHANHGENDALLQFLRAPGQ